MRKVLTKKFFERPVPDVAKDLLGKFLVKKSGKRETAVMMTEVEAYDGFKDKASHASRGRTERNAPMFGEADRWYVYFTYGMHWMLNIVCGKRDYPAAVLIRAVEGVNGPARLTKFLKIGKKINNRPADKKTGLWIEDRGVRIAAREIRRGARIGVDYAGKFWAKRRWRFYISPQSIDAAI